MPLARVVDGVAVRTERLEQPRDVRDGGAGPRNAVPQVCEIALFRTDCEERACFVLSI